MDPLISINTSINWDLGILVRPELLFVYRMQWIYKLLFLNTNVILKNQF